MAGSNLKSRHGQDNKRMPNGRAHESLMQYNVSHILCNVRKTTVSVVEGVSIAVRRYAAERDSSVNALVRRFLPTIAEREESRAKRQA